VIPLTSELAPLYGPALRCKLDLNKCRVVLRFSIWPLHEAIVLLAIMDKVLCLPSCKSDLCCRTGAVV
jgi:hypothetical protein